MDPDLKKLLDILGVATAEEAFAAVAKFNSFLADIKNASGAQTIGEAHQGVTRACSQMRQVEAVTGKTGAEAVGVVTAWKGAAEEAATAKAELAAVNAAKAAEAGKGKIDAAVADGRLRPVARASFEKLFEDFGEAALDAALGALPVSGPSTAPIGSPAPTDAVTTLTAEEREVARQLGLTTEQALANKIDAAKREKAAA